MNEENGDYRVSHLERGATYDSNLAQEPFSAYMTAVEHKYLLESARELFAGGIPKYLDFACGTGRITQVIAPLASQSFGVDVSPTMLAEARKKCPNTQFLHADITKEPVAVDSVDLVTSFRFFGNAQHDLRVAVLSKLQKIMRPGAYLIVNNHRNPRAISNILHRLTGGEMDQDLSYGKFEATLNAAGFRIVKTRPIAAWCVRSRMLATLQLPDARSERLESLFSNPLLSRIAPDTFLVAQRI